MYNLVEQRKQSDSGEEKLFVPNTSGNISMATGKTCGYTEYGGSKKIKIKLRIITEGISEKIG